eukprot:TRINITY_DN28622_c0_g1_i2.p1 TRINITY_DN28622_c0_g1~~TRINITY_DN28622_c0_g1_i2.p1  ORF type:complete len:499 (-),score=139.32 TRINITY_DN28622_c0_g1_i2:143-1639(-)
MGAAASAQEGPQAPPSAEQVAELSAAWPGGTLCVIQGLQSQAGKDLNGRLAEVRAVDEKTGRLCLRLDPRHEPAKWKKLKPTNLRKSNLAIQDSTAECSYCLDSGEEALISPCLCRGSSAGVHLSCLQQAYESRGENSLEYPSCPTCKHPYDGSLALMLLESVRQALHDSLKPGMEVRIDGLKKATDLNGSTAKLKEFDAHTGRWRVQLSESGELKALKPENLFKQADSSQLAIGLEVNALRSLSIAYSSAGQAQNAVSLLEKALLLEEQLFGKEDLELAPSLTNLGIIYHQLGEYSKAVEVLERAVVISEKSGGPDSLKLMAPLANLGGSLSHLGEDRRAMEILERALGIGDRCLDGDHADLVPSLSHLAGTCKKLGEYARAVQCQERLVKAMEKQLGKKHAHLAPALADLADAYGQAKQPEKQRKALEKSLTIVTDESNRGDSLLLPTLQRLAEAYNAIGDEETSLKVAGRATEMVKQLCKESGLSVPFIPPSTIV